MNGNILRPPIPFCTGKKNPALQTTKHLSQTEPTQAPETHASLATFLQQFAILGPRFKLPSERVWSKLKSD